MNLRLPSSLLCVLIGALCSCASLTGAPEMAGAPKSFGRSSSRGESGAQSAVHAVTTRGGVVNERGMPIADATVEVKSSRGSDIVHTDTKGQFEIAVPVGQNESLTFQITSGTMTGEAITKGIGVGVNVVLVNFKLLNNGSLHLVKQDLRY